MNDQSNWIKCATSFTLKTAVGAGAGFLVSYLFKVKHRGFIVCLCAGGGSGLATRDCENIFGK